MNFQQKWKHTPAPNSNPTNYNSKSTIKPPDQQDPNRPETHTLLKKLPPLPALSLSTS